MPIKVDLKIYRRGKRRKRVQILALVADFRKALKELGQTLDFNSDFKEDVDC